MDAVFGWMRGLGPGGLVSEFDVISGRLALGDSWCAALPSGGVEASEEALEEEQPAGAIAVVGVGGKAPGWARVCLVIRSAATKLTRSGSWPEWSAAWAMRDRIA